MPEQIQISSLARRQVLVVDDDATFRLYTAAVVQRAGYGVVEAANGDAALSAIANGGIDLVLLDREMPGRSGIEVLTELRQHHRSLPVILLTGTDTTAQRVEGLKLGADDYLVKPADPRELVARVGAQLRSHDAATNSTTPDVDGLRADVAGIIAQSAFHPVYQPILCLADRRPVAFEALTRFDDGIRPDTRFEDAARAGLGLELEFATLTAAIQWSEHLAPECALHLNVSPDALLCEALPQLLSNVGRPIILEVTEHQPIYDYEGIRAAIDRLGNGIRLAVDDAGAGYASMNHVLALQPAEVKLDRAWIRDVDIDASRRALVAGFVSFAEATGTTLVAEGIERESEALVLDEIGVQCGQGFHLGCPAPARTA